MDVSLDAGDRRGSVDVRRRFRVSSILEPAARERTAPAKRMRPNWILSGLLVAATVPGIPYYILHRTEQVRHPMHDWLKPSGYVGQTAGILALAMFVFLWLYPMRKRVRWLAFGQLPRWLDVHIVVGIAVPIAGAIHASWRFNGLIGLGYFAMLTVALSGFVGRYLYLHIPRSRDGMELTRDQVEAQRRELIHAISRRLGLDDSTTDGDLDAALGHNKPRGVMGALAALAFSNFVTWTAVRRLRQAWQARSVGRGLSRSEIREVGWMIKREIALTQQMYLLDTTRRVFRFWHIAHLPVAITALAAVLIHVAVVMAVGETWFW